MEEEKCKGQHLVDGKTPQATDVHLENRTCDCKKIIYKLEGCGCGNTQKQLKSYPNE